MDTKNNLPLVSLDVMNEVHLEELSIISALLKQLDNKISFELFSKSLQNLLEHMQYHFNSEEKLMKEVQYPSFNMHKAEHDKVINQTRYAQMQWRNKKNEVEIREYLEGEIIPWLDQHIKAMDVPMADFVLSVKNI